MRERRYGIYSHFISIEQNIKAWSAKLPMVDAKKEYDEWTLPKKGIGWLSTDK